jgi:hypothetical protein
MLTARLGAAIVHSGGPFPLGERTTLKKIEEYRRYAAECRDMARMASPAHRLQLHQMAETWEQLAHKREGRKSNDRRPTLENLRPSESAIGLTDEPTGRILT